jgi:hypothetical protein
MVVIAFISDPAVINKILQHLGLPSSPPEVSPAKKHLDEQDFFNGDSQTKPQQHIRMSFPNIPIPPVLHPY